MLAYIRVAERQDKLLRDSLRQVPFKRLGPSPHSLLSFGLRNDLPGLDSSESCFHFFPHVKMIVNIVQSAVVWK